MNRGIVSRIVLDSVSLNSARTIQRIDQTFDLSSAKSFKNEDLQIPANNADLDLVAASHTLNDIEKFVHLQFSRKVRLTLVNDSGTFVMEPDRIFYTADAFTSITITNLNTEQDKSLYVKAIYA